MPQITPNLSMSTYDLTTDAGVYFNTFRLSLAGYTNSALTKIDDWAGQVNADLSDLKSKPAITRVSATSSGANTYVATVPSMTSYVNASFINLSLDVANTGTATLDINGLGAKSLVKINPAGVVVNLNANDLRINKNNLFAYNGTAWVWVNAVSGDQLNVTGTVGNLTKISTNNTLEDTGVTYTPTVVNNNIVQRTSTGQIKTPTAVANDDAINKLYGDTIDNKIGVLANLTTTSKTNAVSAINELDTDVGNLTTLTTAVKTSLVNAINENVSKILVGEDVVGNPPPIEGINAQFLEGKSLSGIVQKTEVVDSLSSTATNLPLSAKQGKNLGDRVLALEGYTNVVYYEPDVYGIEVDFKNNTFTRLAGAVGKTAGVNFNTVKAFGGRRKCNLADNGTVNAYYGDAGYVENGSNGQVMVEQPKFYYKVVPLVLEPIANEIGYHLRKARYYVSDTQKAGMSLHPAFIRNGVVKNKIYLNAYAGSIFDVSAGAYLLADEQVADFNADKFCSIAGAKPASGLTQNLTRANTRKLANNRGAGWQLKDALSVSASQMLMLVEYGSFNMQTTIGLGVVSKASGTGNESEVNGAAASLGNDSGMATGTNGLVSVTYRGEENFWGNIWQWVDGLNIETNKLNYAWYADTGFADDIKNGAYKNAGFTMSKSNNYVSAFGWSETCDFLFLASETLGNSSLPVGDYFYQNNTATGFLVARLGGRWAYSSTAGAFCWSLDVASSLRDRGIGGGVLYIP